MFGWDFEDDAWSRFWRWNSIKICVWTCDKNSTLGSVVPLAMFTLNLPSKCFSWLSRCKQLRILRSLHCSPLFCSSLLLLCWKGDRLRIGHPCLGAPVLYLSKISSQQYSVTFPRYHCSFRTTNVVFLLWQDKIIHEYYTCNAIINDTERPVQNNEDHGASCYIT